MTATPPPASRDDAPLPCPFCGAASAALKETGDGGGRWYVVCGSSKEDYCDVVPATEPEETRREAVAKWNRRASVAPPAPTDAIELAAFAVFCSINARDGDTMDGLLEIWGRMRVDTNFYVFPRKCAAALARSGPAPAPEARPDDFMRGYVAGTQEQRPVAVNGACPLHHGDACLRVVCMAGTPEVDTPAPSAPPAPQEGAE